MADRGLVCPDGEISGGGPPTFSELVSLNESFPLQSWQDVVSHFNREKKQLLSDFCPSHQPAVRITVEQKEESNQMAETALPLIPSHSEVSHLQGPSPNQLHPPYCLPAPTVPQHTPAFQNQPFSSGPYPTQPFIYQPNTNNLTIMMQPTAASAPFPAGLTSAAGVAGAAGAAPPPIRHNDYLCWSICSMICCFPLGLLAIIYACKTQSASNARNESASSHSRIARNLNIAALVLGILFDIVVPIVIIVTTMTRTVGPASYSYNYNSRSRY